MTGAAAHFAKAFRVRATPCGSDIAGLPTWMAECPVCEDGTSVFISETEPETITLACRDGCDAKALLTAWGYRRENYELLNSRTFRWIVDEWTVPVAPPGSALDNYAEERQLAKLEWLKVRYEVLDLQSQLLWETSQDAAETATKLELRGKCWEVLCEKDALLRRIEPPMEGLYIRMQSKPKAAKERLKLTLTPTAEWYSSIMLEKERQTSDGEWRQSFVLEKEKERRLRL